MGMTQRDVVGREVGGGVMFGNACMKPGESRQVSIDLPRSRFETWDSQTNTMRVVPGEYELMVGTSSSDKDLQKFIINI